MIGINRLTKLPARAFHGPRRIVFGPCAALPFLLLTVTVAGCSPVSPPVPTTAPAALKATSPAASSVSIELTPESDDKHHFVLNGLDGETLAALESAGWDREQWQKLLAISVAGRSPMLGAYEVSGETLRFVPRFTIAPGIKYEAQFDPAELPEPIAALTKVTQEFELPKPDFPPTVLRHVYPSRDVLPENLLKFYLHFSAPMRQGDVYRHIHLVMSSGEEVTLPFLELDEELWDPDTKRLTLLIDPGRIKRGLKPREDLGPVLEEGKSYTLVIDSDWLDTHGNPLKEPYRKKFDVGPADDVQPDQTKWRIVSPPADTTQALVVTFGEPLDHAMVNRVIVPIDREGKRVPGRIEVDAEETRWRFIPDAPWKPGSYALSVDSTLEDLAANSIARPFEVDVTRKIEQRVTTEMVSVPFEILPAADEP